MENLNQKAALFIGESVIKYRSKLIEFHPSKRLGAKGLEYTGCASKDLLQIATGYHFDTWFEIFVHETSHLDQQKERPKWFGHRLTKVFEFNEFLLKRGSIEWRDVFKILELEHDCELRSLDKIVSYDLPINYVHYSQRANAYLLTYVKAFKTGKWSNGKWDAWKTMPKTIIPLKELI